MKEIMETIAKLQSLLEDHANSNQPSHIPDAHSADEARQMVIDSIFQGAISDAERIRRQLGIVKQYIY